MITGLLLWVTLLGCGGKIKTLYDEQKSSILAAPPQLDNNWNPDMRLRIGYDTITKLAKQNLQKSIEKGSFDISFLGTSLQLKTNNTVSSFTIENANGSDRFKFNAKVTGNISCNTKIINFDLPYSGQITGTTKLSYENGLFLANLNNVDNLSVGLQKHGQLNLNRPLQKWIRLAIKDSPPIRLGELNTKALPLRDIRVKSSRHSADLEMRSDVATQRNLKPARKKPSDDWELQVSNELVNLWMRKAAFEKGVIDMGVAVDPTSFVLDGDDFLMGLRLWKIKGCANWWRDYTIKGDITVDKDIKLISKNVEEQGKSPGARFVDPLALLAEGYILDIISKNIAYATPSRKSQTMNGQLISAKINAISGNKDAVVVSGQLHMTAKTKKHKKRNKAK